MDSRVLVPNDFDEMLRHQKVSDDFNHDGEPAWRLAPLEESDIHQGYRGFEMLSFCHSDEKSDPRQFFHKLQS